MEAIEIQKSTRRITPTVIASLVSGVAAWYAPKDFMAPGPLRGVIRGCGLAVGLGLYVLDTAKTRENVAGDIAGADGPVTVGSVAGDSELTSGTESSAASVEVNKPLFVALVVAAALLVVASFGLGLVLEKKAISVMERRGVRYPNTIWGVVNAAAAVGTLFLDDIFDATAPGGVCSK